MSFSLAQNSSDLPLPPLPHGWTTERLRTTSFEEKDAIFTQDDWYLVEAHSAEINRRETLHRQLHGDPEPPLPPGWTRDRAMNTSHEETVAQTTEAEQDLLFDYRVWVIRAESAAAKAERKHKGLPDPPGLDPANDPPDSDQSTEEDQAAFRGPWPHPSQLLAGLQESGTHASSHAWHRIFGWTGNPEAVVEHLSECRSTGFGFIVFKTWGYDNAEDQQLWAAFWDGWRAYFDDVFHKSTSELSREHKRLLDPIRWHLVEDASKLENKTIAELRNLLEEVADDEDLPDGLERAMALVPDQALARALLDGQQGKALAVMAVDVEGDGQLGGDQELMLQEEQRLRQQFNMTNNPMVQLRWYPGYVRLALDALLWDVFPKLQTDDAAQFWIRNNGVYPWDSNDRDMTGVRSLIEYTEKIDGTTYVKTY